MPLFAAVGTALGATAATATATGVIAVGAAGLAASSIVSANQQRKAAEKAADAQKAVGLAQIEAPIKAEQAAAETAKQQRLLKIASRSQSILTSPLGVDDSNAGYQQKSILGVA